MDKTSKKQSKLNRTVKKMKGNKSPGCGRGEQDQVLLLGALVARGFAALCPRVFGEPCFFNLQPCEENLVVPGAGVHCRLAIILIMFLLLCQACFS